MWHWAPTVYVRTRVIDDGLDPARLFELTPESLILSAIKVNGIAPNVECVLAVA